LTAPGKPQGAPPPVTTPDGVTAAHRLKRSVKARDRLALRLEQASQALPLSDAAPLDDDAARTRALLARNARDLAELAQDLRVYQAELHAQADELAASRARNDDLLARFATLFAQMPVAALLMAGTGQVLEFNSRADRLLALQQRPPAARYLHRLVDAQAYQDRVRPAFHEAQAAGCSVVDEVCFGSGDHRFMGELHIAWLPGVPAEGNGAATRGQAEEASFVCAVIDRTQQLAAVQALRSSERALRDSRAMLAESARLARTGGWELLLPQRQWRFSTELRQLLALPAEARDELQTLLDRCARVQGQQLGEALRGAERGQPFELEIPLTTADGRALHVLLVGQPETAGVDGEVRRVTGVLQDVSASVLARQEIRELSERLDLAYEAGGIGVWDWDTRADTVIIDERMARLIGLPAAGEVPGMQVRRTLRDALPAPESERLHEALQALVQQGRPLALELCRAAQGGGSERWLHLTARLHREPRSGASHVVGSAWDCSVEHEAARLLAAKASAEAASRSKSAFLSRMSHELRTPLNAILGFAQLMRMQAEAGDLLLRPHRVELIETAARHLLDLVNEVLDISRIDSGQMPLNPVPLDLREVVAESLGLVQAQAQAAGVALADETAAGPPLPLCGDRLRLKEVLINLLSNGIKYNNPGGTVRVWSSQDDGGARLLHVADTGRGLSPAQLKDLFQPFNRLGAEATGVEGTGMGLYVSRRFVELMGGSIEVQSQPGQGSHFSVRLPGG
jgi:signal transduction histidine kinase